MWYRSFVKARYAAALGLVGWYLILPPVNPTSANSRRSMDGAWWTDIRAKLKDWQVTESFDEAADCEIARDKTIEDSRKPRRGHSSGYQRAFRIAESHAQCIASKEK